MKNLLLLSFVALLTGCAHIMHERPVPVKLPNGESSIGYEREHASAFLMKGAIEKMRITTKDKDYSHTFTAAGVQGAGDTEMAETLIKGGAEAFAKGAKAGAGIP